jgi:hypothetical protein
VDGERQHFDHAERIAGSMLTASTVTPTTTPWRRRARAADARNDDQECTYCVVGDA